jgi:hypothetical protein
MHSLLAIEAFVMGAKPGGWKWLPAGPFRQASTSSAAVELILPRLRDNGVSRAVLLMGFNGVRAVACRRAALRSGSARP